jgi:hypothetical protein
MRVRAASILQVSESLVAMRGAGAGTGQLVASGMWGEFAPPPSSHPAGFEDPAAAWASAAQSFPLEGDAGDFEKRQWPSPAGAVAAADPSQGAAADKLPAGGLVVVHCWLPGLPEPKSPNAAGADPTGAAEGAMESQQGWQGRHSRDQAAPLSAAAALAEAYAQALRQLQGAEQLSGAGAGATSATSAAAAMDALQQALAAVSGDALLAGRQGGRSQPELSLALGPKHVLHMRLLAAAMRAAVATGDSWAQALDWACQLLPLYDFVYPEVNMRQCWSTRSLCKRCILPCLLGADSKWTTTMLAGT